MTTEVKKKHEKLSSDLQAVNKNYEQAKNVMLACERKILQLEGGIIVLEELLNKTKTT